MTGFTLTSAFVVKLLYVVDSYLKYHPMHDLVLLTATAEETETVRYALMMEKVEFRCGSSRSIYKLVSC